MFIYAILNLLQYTITLDLAILGTILKMTVTCTNESSH